MEVVANWMLPLIKYYMNKNIVGVFISNFECSEELGQEYLF